MRSFLLIFGSLLVLLAALGVYALWLGGGSGVPPQERTRADTPPTVAPPLRDERPGVVGPGERPWINRYNERAELASRFRAARYEPRGAGSVHVVSPVFEFFLEDGQVLRLQGESGEITVEEIAGTDPALSLTHGQVPNRGEFRDVLISLFPGDPQASEAQLTIRVENAAFDNDTFRVYSESFTDAGGQRIARDQVPVRLRSAGYDFDGRGLIIRWNERDQYLEYVEITHGERLVVRNEAMADQLRARPPSGGAAQRVEWSGAAAMTPQPPPADDATPRPQDTPRPQQRLYRASFNDQVRIEQADQTLLEADRLHALFHLHTPVATAGSATPAQPVDPASSPPPAAPGPAADSPPAEPLLVYWSGRLTLTPEVPQQPLAVPRGETVVEIEGAPVRLHWQGSNVAARYVRYHTADSAMFMRGGDEHPVELLDARGQRIVTSSLRYDPQSGLAILEGAGRAEFADTGDQTVTRAAWQRRCTLTLQGDARGRLAIERAVLEEAVRIDHPQLTLSSERLDLRFDPQAEAAETAQPHLRQLIATGSARAVLLDEQQREQLIAGDELTVDTAARDGRLYPRRIAAAGNAVISDPEQQLQAGSIAIDLQPVTAGGDAASATHSVELSRMRAEGDVRLSGRAGAAGRGETLDVRMIDGHPQVELIGEPMAELIDGGTLLRGQRIVLLPDQEQARVHGPGMLRTMRADEGGAERPAEVSWQHQALVDLPANRADVAGDVRASMVQSDGSLARAQSQRVQIELADAPGAPAGERPARTVPSMPHGVPSLGSKAIHAITFREAVDLSSTEMADDGALLRRMHLLTDELRYTYATGALRVPGPGRILHEDYRPEDARARGATAIEWTSELDFDPRRQVMNLSGSADAAAGHRGVVIVHRPQDDQQPLRVTAPRVEAEFYASGDDEAAAGGGLRRLSADDGVHFTRGGVIFEAASMEYDAAADMVTARGSERHPAQRLDEQGLSRGAFEELRYRITEDRLEIRGATGGFRSAR